VPMRCSGRREPSRGGSVTQLLPKFWGSFSSSYLVTWAAQVAGGDEPPSVLSDNLSKVWLTARPFAISAATRSLTVNIPRCVGCSRCTWRACPVQREQTWFSSSPSDQISQIGIANCCADNKFRSTVDLGSFPFRYKRAGAERRGKTSGASDVPLRSRVRSPSSAGRHPCRDRPGRSGGGGTIGSLSRQERESPGG
jgi:hypothetical protein